MQLKDVISVLDSLAPFETAEEWDNTGLMVGDPLQEIHTILVALDPSYEVISSAESSNIDLIVTHHPLIFSPLKHMNLGDAVARKIGMLIRSGTSLVSMHTNLDTAREGVADVLAECLSLKDIQSFGFLKTGTIEEEMSLSAWAESLPFGTMRLVDAGRPVKKVCACPGSGMQYLREACDMGCDTFVTGDVRYHAAIDAREAGINVVDPGHFGTEQIAMAPLAERLSRALPGISARVYDAKDVFTNIKGEPS